MLNPSLPYFSNHLCIQRQPFLIQLTALLFSYLHPVLLQELATIRLENLLRNDKFVLTNLGIQVPNQTQNLQRTWIKFLVEFLQQRISLIQYRQLFIQELGDLPIINSFKYIGTFKISLETSKQLVVQVYLLDDFLYQKMLNRFLKFFGTLLNGSQTVAFLLTFLRRRIHLLFFIQDRYFNQGIVAIIKFVDIISLYFLLVDWIAIVRVIVNLFTQLIPSIVLVTVETAATVFDWSTGWRRSRRHQTSLLLLHTLLLIIQLLLQIFWQNQRFISNLMKLQIQSLQRNILHDRLKNKSVCRIALANSCMNGASHFGAECLNLGTIDIQLQYIFLKLLHIVLVVLLKLLNFSQLSFHESIQLLRLPLELSQLDKIVFEFPTYFLLDQTVLLLNSSLHVHKHTSRKGLVINLL